MATPGRSALGAFFRSPLGVFGRRILSYSHDDTVRLYGLEVSLVEFWRISAGGVKTLLGTDSADSLTVFYEGARGPVDSTFFYGGDFHRAAAVVDTGGAFSVSPADRLSSPHPGWSYDLGLYATGGDGVSVVAGEAVWGFTTIPLKVPHLTYPSSQTRGIATSRVFGSGGVLLFAVTWPARDFGVVPSFHSDFAWVYGKIKLGESP